MYYWKDWKNWKGVASTRGFPFVDPKICSHLFSQGLSEVEEVSGLENGPVAASTGNRTDE